MKKVHNRQHSGMTMTVKELKDVLGGYPDDMAILATWEGVSAGFRGENFSVYFDERFQEDRLEINVDCYG